MEPLMDRVASEATQASPPRPAGAAPYAKLAARDLGLVAVALLLWSVAAPWSAGPGALADLTGVVVGAALGALTFLFHEWGHLLGALATRSEVKPAPSWRSAFLFSFDSRRNSRSQFLVMSFSGFAATGLAVWAWYALLPPELLASRVARGLGLVSVALTLVLEVPLVVWALGSRKLPPVETFSRRRGRPGPRA